MMMSPTSEVTMPPKAAPMITPTARSTTLPFMANSRNSFSIRKPLSSTALTAPSAQNVVVLVDQARMHHGAAHRRARRLGHRHHRQPQLLVHFAEQRKRILNRCRIGLDEEVHVQRHQLV